jgi:hypothetical protein
MTDLRALLAAAMPGPWEHVPLPFGDGPLPEDALIFGPDGDSFVRVAWNPGLDNDQYADAALIVAAVNALPALLDVVDAAREYVERLPDSRDTALESDLAEALARLETSR